MGNLFLFPEFVCCARRGPVEVLLKYLLWLVISLLSPNLFGQLNNTVFEERYKVLPEDSGKLFLRLVNYNFLRNNEYFQNIIPGYTLFGQQVQPKLAYQPLPHVVLEAGALLWKDFGNDQFTRVVPTFTFKYQKDSLSFLFGTLEGNLNHRLIEPIVGFERSITRRAENGLQLISNRQKLFLDVWIDWLRATYPKADYQEQISGGFSLNYQLMKRPGFRLEIPIQWMALHRGGQGLALRTPIPLTNLMSSAVGLSVIPDLGNRSKKWVKSVRLDTYLVYANNFSPVSNAPFKYGSGLYVNLTMNTKMIDVMASYWLSNRFQWPLGGDLYQSVDTDLSYPDSLQYQRRLLKTKFNSRMPPPRPPDYTVGHLYREPIRELLIVRLMRNFRITRDIFLVARFEAVFRPDLQNIDYSEGLYVTYRHEFLIKKLKHE